LADQKDNRTTVVTSAKAGVHQVARLDSGFRRNDDLKGIVHDPACAPVGRAESWLSVVHLLRCGDGWHDERERG
jgi:hypothetical protein